MVEAKIGAGMRGKILLSLIIQFNFITISYQNENGIQAYKDWGIFGIFCDLEPPKKSSIP